jgi:hypothetical protein
MSLAEGTTPPSPPSPPSAHQLRNKVCASGWVWINAVLDPDQHTERPPGGGISSRGTHDEHPPSRCPCEPPSAVSGEGPLLAGRVAASTRERETPPPPSRINAFDVGTRLPRRHVVMEGGLSQTRIGSGRLFHPMGCTLGFNPLGCRRQGVRHHTFVPARPGGEGGCIRT